MKERSSQLSTEQPCYTLINQPSDAEQPSETQLRLELEKGDLRTKTEALKKVIFMIMNGEKLPGLLMIVIRFCLPLQDHIMKKLLLVYWEIVPKTSPDGKLLHEMILVCDSFRRDLQHPNEFIRGSTLRFLCKLREPELLEPLMPAMIACLDHRHAYVRRNAVLAIFTIYKSFDHLIPDAPELVSKFLETEQDMSCRRNAFLMLLQVDQGRALSYLSSVLEQVGTFGDILQLVIVELIYKVCRSNPAERSKFIRCIYNLLSSNSPAVRYEAAGTLVTLSTAPTAIKAAATCYIELIIKESENNIKLIVLERLSALRESSSSLKVIEELVMDILRILSSPDMEVRKKTLALALDLLTNRTVGEAVNYLKKELLRTHSSIEVDDSGKYKQLLVQTLHHSAIKYADVASSIIPVLMDFLSDSNDSVAGGVMLFMREAIQKYSHLIGIIVEKMMEVFPSIRSSRVVQSTIWILCEFVEKREDITQVVHLIQNSLGELPLVESELRKLAIENGEGESEVKEEKSHEKSQGSRLVTSDGTYATQSAFSMQPSTNKNEKTPSLRKICKHGDFYITAAIASSLTKMMRRLIERSQGKSPEDNRLVAQVLFILTSIIRYGVSGMSSKRITSDDIRRILTCMEVMSEGNEGGVSSIFTSACRSSLGVMLKEQAAYQATNLQNKVKKAKSVQADDGISFLQLMARNQMVVGDDVFELSLSQAVGFDPRKENIDFSSSKLSKVTQLTGFSDPVYAEAYINVNQFDIVLDVLIVNQTNDTLQNCTLELATLGDLKLVERPQSLVLGPHDFSNIRASIKVASTENGVIFGNIVYDVSGAGSDRNIVVMSDIHIDIMDYIMPATCTDQEFRSMWAEFEWENKVTINTNQTDLNEYLKNLLKSTNMGCLTPELPMFGDCGFMAVNLYAKSIFGEDALANLSVEKNSKNPLAPLTGHIRVRAKSQGMALSLGDKINASQKSVLASVNANLAQSTLQGETLSEEGADLDGLERKLSQ